MCVCVSSFMLWNDIKPRYCGRVIAEWQRHWGQRKKKLHLLQNIHQLQPVVCIPIDIWVCIHDANKLNSAHTYHLSHVQPHSSSYQCVCNSAVHYLNVHTVPCPCSCFSFCANKCHFKPFNLIECYNMLWAHNSSSAVSFCSFHSCSWILTQLTWFNKWYTWIEFESWHVCVCVYANKCLCEWTLKERERWTGSFIDRHHAHNTKGSTKLNVDFEFIASKQWKSMKSDT